MTGGPAPGEPLRAYPGIVLAVDRDGRIAWSNQRLDALLEVDLPGQEFVSILHPSSVEKGRRLLEGSGSEAPWELLLTGPDAPRMTTFIAGRDSTHLWLFEDPFAAGRDARFERLTGIHSDLVTAQRQLARERAEVERALDREEQAVAAARAALESRDAVLRVVAHDLRNPVATIATVASMLSTMELTNEQRRRQLEIVRDVSDQMDRLVQDLLDVARTEAGALHLTTRAVPPGELIESTVDLFADRARQEGVALEVAVAPDLPPVAADRDRVLRVLANLVGNALKFGRRGGRVEIRARASAEAVRFAVVDDGPGIEPRHQTRLFTPFWQGEDAREGAGLGLAISHSIVELHGGELWVESAVGEGASFFFTLPVA